MILSPTPSEPGADRYTYSGVHLLRVVDGDTLLLRFPLPFNVARDLDVRLLGINSPEKVGANRGAGIAASEYLRALLGSAEALRARSHKTDRYGRYLAEVWALFGGQWVNLSLAMLDAGHATPYDGGART